MTRKLPASQVPKTSSVLTCTFLWLISSRLDRTLSMIYLPKRISKVFIFFTAFLLFLTISLVNLPMSLGCGDWIASLFYGDDPYTVVGFWRRDINFVFMLISFGCFLFVVVCFDHACKYFCSDLCLFSSCFFCFYSFFSHVWPGIPPYIVFIRHFCFFVNMNCKAPHTLAYGFHLIGNLDWTENVVFYL